MPSVTIRNVPDEVHRAIRVRAAQHGRSIEAEMRDILESAVKPQGRVKLGSMLAEIGQPDLPTTKNLALNERDYGEQEDLAVGAGERLLVARAAVALGAVAMTGLCFLILPLTQTIGAKAEAIEKGVTSGAEHPLDSMKGTWKASGLGRTASRALKFAA